MSWWEEAKHVLVGHEGKKVTCIVALRDTVGIVSGKRFLLVILKIFDGTTIEDVFTGLTHTFNPSTTIVHR